MHKNINNEAGIVNEEYVPVYSFARECEICGESFEIEWYQNKVICPECKKRLMKLLYGEEDKNA